MAKYFVTGVFKDAKKVITHLALHQVGENNIFQVGKKTSVADAVSLIDSGNQLSTIRWDYKDASWHHGAKIIVVKDGLTRFVKTVPDAQLIDNLDNMINLNSLY